MTMSNLPKECRLVLEAPSPELEMAATFKGGGGGGTSIAAVIQSAGDPAATEIAPDEGVIGANAFLPADGVRIPLPEWRPQK